MTVLIWTGASTTTVKLSTFDRSASAARLRILHSTLPRPLASVFNMAYFFSTPVDIDIVLDDGDDRQMVDMKTEKGRREKAPLYKDGESVKGAVTIRPKDGKRLEHTGIKVQFIGTIGMYYAGDII